MDGNFSFPAKPPRQTTLVESLFNPIHSTEANTRLLLHSHIGYADKTRATRSFSYLAQKLMLYHCVQFDDLSISKQTITILLRAFENAQIDQRRNSLAALQFNLVPLSNASNLTTRTTLAIKSSASPIS